MGSTSKRYDIGRTNGPLSPKVVGDLEQLLKLCPFCGGMGRLRNTWTASYWIECENQSCAAEVGGVPAKDATSQEYADHRTSASMAVRRWNRRAA